MSHAGSVVIQAIAEQMLGELDAYELLLARLVGDPRNPELMQLLSEQTDRIYLCGQTVPRIAVSFTEFLVTRAELTHALWAGNAARAGEPAETLHLEHLAAIELLRRACRRVCSAAAASRSGTGEGSASALEALRRLERTRH